MISLSFSLYANSKVLLVFGDSLSAAYRIPQTQGWVALLDEKLKTEYPHWSVINASVVGETTSGGRQRLPALLERDHPTLVILELGGNDGLRGHPPLLIQKNLEFMIQACQKVQAQVLLIGMKMPPNYGGPYTQQFEQIFPDLSKEYDLPFVPFFLEKVALNPKLMQSDHIHPTAEAQPLLLEVLLPVLMPLLNQPSL